MIEQKEVIKMDMYQKRKIRAEKKKDDSPKSFPSVGINCLPCIYTVHCLNPYKMGLFSKQDLASFNQKSKNN